MDYGETRLCWSTEPDTLWSVASIVVEVYMIAATQSISVEQSGKDFFQLSFFIVL